MSLVDNNSLLPCLSHPTNAYQNYRLMSTSINSKNTNSSSSATSSNKFKPIPRLIALCIHPDENYALRMISMLISSHSSNSSNIHDEFGCNLLMYSLRFQRYRLFRYLLNEKSLDINLHANDRYGNTILHYAILYGGNDSQIIDELIENYNKFAIEIDRRNNYGFTPLLLAIFCGRYDFVLSLLTKTDASPFVRDYIQLKSMFDYIEIDVKHKDLINQCQNKHYSISNLQLKRLRIQLHQCIPTRQETPFLTMQSNINKNFFEIILPQVVQDKLNLLRSSIMEMYDYQYSSTNLKQLLTYLNRRYPRIKFFQLPEDSLGSTITTAKSVFQRDNSKTNLHHILNLFDPNPRPNVMPPKLSPQKLLSTTKTPMAFKRLSTKITTLTAFSRVQIDKKRSSFLTTRVK
ncbi:unnamed protein product [Rotaria socialis]|uniref:Uncharacterized protein n=1 Tax=Rotaria socialis TaxID=392032 RepID=A0A817VD34_9BILA|nr:unnamed protein product [Rotaria socialis]CAF3345034.1 unnamed protein product [Rotaria socialis]CAF3429693.1 unnamed protein product [Rotaria socialis]CAF3461289.1 unnamed protein product [Rotaria socialis]CAF4210360.1 unnamed protein product [Rotaria socialis]